MIDKLCEPELPSKQRLMQPQKRERIILKRKSYDTQETLLKTTTTNSKNNIINNNNDSINNNNDQITLNKNNTNGFTSNHQTSPLSMKLEGQTDGIKPSPHETAQNGNTVINNLSPTNKTILPYPTGPLRKLVKTELNPPTPSIFVQSEAEIFSPQMQEFCLVHPIAVIRNISRVLKLNLGLFSSKTLVDHDSNHLIEVRLQLEQPSDQNWDHEKRTKIWRCESPRRFLKIVKYAQYQAKTFEDHLNKIEDDNGKKEKQVTFGTNVDLSDGSKWKKQLDELDKLPTFLRVISPSNMLSHVGHPILGMNTVQLYMKVPGCRTPGHQENNNFCSVNINIGPGDCEWFGVPEEYWGPMAKLCAENGTNFVHGSWWPNLDDLYSYNIPVYRFLQKPGDLVWVNTGTVHWVQAVGWCNNIAWNVGPITTKQFRSSIERYEWNKVERYKSIVPMIHLTWNLARNVEIMDAELFQVIKNFMTTTLSYCERIIKMLEDSNIEIRWHGKAPHEPAHYCINCNIEVFNILFVKAKKIVYCAKCAIETSHVLENFVVLQEYDINYLKETYSNFIQTFKSRRITGTNFTNGATTPRTITN